MNQLYAMNWLVKGVIGSARASWSWPRARAVAHPASVPTTEPPARRGRHARDHEALPRRARQRRRRLRGRGRARCMRCSARTAPARRRSRTSSPGSTGRTRARSELYGRAGRVPLAARRARRRDLHGAPALPARRAVHRRRERPARRPSRRGRGAFRLQPRAIERRVAELGERYGLAVDPRARIWQLSVGEQQRVEILKALYRDARVLILDEPTAVLTPQEARVALRDAAARWRTRAARSSSSRTSCTR